MESYETLSEAISALRKQGYVIDFNQKKNWSKLTNEELHLSPEEYKIDKVFRFEDNTDPDDQSVLYAISSDKYRLKGIIVNSYGIYSDTITNELIEKLKAK